MLMARSKLHLLDAPSAMPRVSSCSLAAELPFFAPAAAPAPARQAAVPNS